MSTPARSSWRRRLTVAAATTGLIALTGVWALHWSFVQNRVRTLLVSRLAGAGIDAEIGRLAYNLLTLEASVDDITLTTAGADRSFFGAEHVDVDLTWHALGGGLQIRRLALDRPYLDLTRDGEGRLNLPGGSDAAADSPPADASPRRIHIDELQLRNLDVRYVDSSARLDIAGRGLSIEPELSPDPSVDFSGRLALQDGLTVTWNDQATTIRRLEGRWSFANPVLRMSELHVAAPEADLQVDGTFDVLSDPRRVDVTYQGSVALAEIARWFGTGEVPETPDRGALAGLTGELAVDGSAAGALSRPDVTLHLSGQQLRARGVDIASLQADVATTGSLIDISGLQARLAGGALAGEIELDTVPEGTSRARIQWTGLDVGRLLEALAFEGPLRIAAASEGAATAEWPGLELTGGTVEAELQLRAQAGTAALPLDGPVTVGINQERWRVTTSNLRVGEATVRVESSGRLAREAPADSTLEGRLGIQVPDLGALRGQLARAGFDRWPEALADLSGAVELDGTLRGTLRAPHVDGDLTGRELQLPGIAPSQLIARISLDASAIQSDRWRLTTGPNELIGTVAADLDAGTLAGRFDATLPRLDLLAEALPDRWRPVGAARVGGTIGGALTQPTIEGTVTTGAIEAAGQRLDQLTASFRLAEQVLHVDALEIVQREGRGTDGNSSAGLEDEIGTQRGEDRAGRLRLSGRYELPSARYALTATGRNLHVVPIVADTGDPESPEVTARDTIPIQTRFDLDVTSEGTWDAPAGRGSILLTDFSWDRYRLGAATLELEAAEGALHLAARVPSVDARLEASLALEDPRTFTTTLDIDGTELEPLLAWLEPPRDEADATVETGRPIPDRLAQSPDIGGAIQVHAAARGRMDDWRNLDGEVDIGLLDATLDGIPVQLDRGARLSYRAGTVIADDLVFRLGRTELALTGSLVPGDPNQPGLAMTLQGTLEDLTPVLQVVLGPQALDTLEAQGTVSLTLRASGALQAPDLQGDLSLIGGSIRLPDLPTVAQLTLRGTLDGGMLTLSDFRGVWQGASVTAVGSIPLRILGDRLPEDVLQSLPESPDRARLSVSISSVTPDVLVPFIDANTLDRLDGILASTITLDAPSLALEDLTADITLTRAEVAAAGVSLRQEQPTRLRFAQGRLDVVDWTWFNEGQPLTVTGGVQLDADAPLVDVTLAGALDLRLLAAISRDFVTQGLARFDVHAVGPIRGPDIDGRLVLQDAGLAVREPALAITDLAGTVALTGDRLQIVEMTGNANGGSLALSGEFLYPDFTIVGGYVSLAGRGLALEVPQNLVSEVDVDLTFIMSEERPTLTGRVTVLRGSYREPISLAGQLLSQIEIRSTAPLEPGLLDEIDLSIGIVSEEGILVDNNYGRLEVESGLRVAGSAAAPGLAGRLTLVEGGVIFLAGHTWTIERGTVDFVNPARIEPTFDLGLVTRVQQYEVRLSVSGTPDTLEASLTSPDGLSQADAVSLLLTGVKANDSTAAQMDIARGQLVLLLSGELLGFAGRAVGLDSAQVSRGLGGAASDFDLLATDTDPSTRLTISKQLRADTEVIVSQSLRETSDLAWVVIHRPSRTFEVRTTASGEDDRSYEFRHELTFGGGSGASTGTSRETTRIVGLRVSGNPGFEDDILRDQLRLEEGDTFDFFRWYEDRDRLARFFHQRGYLEVDIQATREPAPTPNGAAGLALQYGIARGPLTTLRVEGASLPRGIRDQMRDIWGRAVFDGFLLEDLEQLARRTLISQGYVSARARAEVAVSTPEEKTILVTLEPGARFADRRLDFDGQRQLSEAELRQLIRSRDLGLSAWSEPDQVVDALTGYYQSLGHVAVQVEAGMPRLDGPTAILPIHIEEGPQARITGVALNGVASRSPDEVLRVFGMSPGQPYVPTQLEPARGAVERSYLREGFNDVRVSITSLVDAAQAGVQLTVTVDEGRQQRLQDVVVTGADRTSQVTLDRTLALPIGAPADLGETYRAQKRLYDTGIFRRAEIDLSPLPGAEAGGAQPVRASVVVEEMPAYRLRYGFRLSDKPSEAGRGRDIEPAAVVDLLRRNLFGRAVSAGVAGQVERDRRLVRGIFSSPRFFGLPLRSSIFITRSRTDLPDPWFIGVDEYPIFIDASELTLEQRIQPRPSMLVSYNYRFTRNHTFADVPIGTPATQDFNDTVDVARLTGSFAWDRRDDPFDAHTGWFHSSGLEYSVPGLGSELHFVKVTTQQEYFATVAPSTVLASSFRLGAARAFDQDILIFNERFYLGGEGTVRGFSEDGIGGRDFFGFPVGGNAFVSFNQEVRFPIYRWLGGVGFVDAGNVFPLAREISLRNLEVGTGAGLRIQTPFGLGRIDFGIPLTSRQDEPFGRWYFSLGQSF